MPGISRLEISLSGQVVEQALDQFLAGFELAAEGAVFGALDLHPQFREAVLQHEAQLFGVFRRQFQRGHREFLPIVDADRSLAEAASIVKELTIDAQLRRESAIFRHR